MKTYHGILPPARWLALALLTPTLALPALAQSPLPDSFNPGADNWVYCLAVQADGKILAGGAFAKLGGQSRSYFGRLNADGTLDASFNPRASWDVFCLALQADGKILVGGEFNTLGGRGRNYIGRLNADGTLDTSFNPEANGYVCSLALQADGKILVGGGFTTLDGQQSRQFLGRLDADGTLDTNFNLGPYPYLGVGGDSVYSLALQPDGKILVGGGFDSLGKQDRNYIGRLGADGSVDTSFNPGANDWVYSLALQADGKILVGGDFTALAGQSRTFIGRLNADGTLDTSFNPGANNPVVSLALQADGKILVGGGFTMLGGQSCNYIGRLNPDGTVDTSFNPGVGGGSLPPVLCLALQADGKILVGGCFTTLGGLSRANIGRLYNTEPATQSLTFDGSTLTWMRGGASPEVWRTTFEHSPDGGTTWTNLGAGVRISGGWQMTGLALPTNTTFQACGYTVGGEHNASAWCVESILQPPLVISAVCLSTPGQFGFSAGGPFGQVVVLETSPDLRAWTPLQTNTLGAGPLLFSDPQPASLPARFYRLRSGP